MLLCKMDILYQCLVFMSLLVSQGIQRGESSLQISPYPISYVKENDQLTISCNASHNAFNFIRWVKDSAWIYDIFIADSCVDFNNNINLSVYQFTCSGNIYTWTIKHVTRQHHGEEWCCETLDVDNSRSFTTRIFVQVPVTAVSFSMPPETNFTVRENESVRLQCTTSTERPRSTIRWYITSRSSPLGIATIQPMDNDTLVSTIGRLNFIFDRTENSQQLYCTALNLNGENHVESSRKQIIVEYGTSGPPFIVGFSAGDTYKAIISVQQSLTCSVIGGNPAPSVSWNCFSGTVTEDIVGQNETRQRITWTANHRNGTSTCKCVSNQTISGQQEVILNVEVLYQPSSPTIFVRDTPVNDTFKIIQGNSLLVSCQSSSNPNPSYKWTNNKTNVALSVQNLTIQDVSLSDEASYTCTATNNMIPTQGSPQTGISFSSFSLDVLYKPEVFLEDHAVKENDPLLVSCSARGNPEPTSFTWLRSKDSFRQQHSDLLIQNTRREDTDTYTCIASNIMMPTISAPSVGTASGTMTVTILYHPDVAALPLNGTTIAENYTNVVIMCSAKGEPQQYTFYNWVHYTIDGGTKVKEYSSTLIEGGTAYLIFRTVSYMNSGIYSCFVDNGIDDYRTRNMTATNNTMLVVKGTPVITDSSRNVTPKMHRNATLWVAFYSNDGIDPSVQWYKLENDTSRSITYVDKRYSMHTSAVTVNVAYHSVTIHQQGHMSQLLIQNITKSDLGNYEVAVSNSIGTAVWGLSLNEQTPLQNVEVNNIGAVAGGVTAAVLGLVVIILGVLLVRYRYGQIACCWKKTASNDNRGIAFTSVLGKKVRGNVEKEETNAGLNDSRTGVSQYEVLSSKRDPSQPYERLQAAAESNIEQKSSNNFYEELNQTKNAMNVHSEMQDGASEGNQQTVVYSNLKLTHP